MEITAHQHPLRTMILRYDRNKPVPEFERDALQSYREIHDRVWEIKQRINEARRKIPAFKILIEELDALFQEAKSKFKHLQIAEDTNPYKSTLRLQLMKLLQDMDDMIRKDLPPFLKETAAYFDYDAYGYAHDQWMNEVAFPQFRGLIQNYQDCSVDLVFFDADLEDFHKVLHFVKQQEGKYFEEMDDVVDGFTEVNDALDDFFEEIEKFDEALMATGLR